MSRYYISAPYCTCQASRLSACTSKGQLLLPFSSDQTHIATMFAIWPLRQPRRARAPPSPQQREPQHRTAPDFVPRAERSVSSDAILTLSAMFLPLYSRPELHLHTLRADPDGDSHEPSHSSAHLPGETAVAGLNDGRALFATVLRPMLRWCDDPAAAGACLRALGHQTRR